MPTVISQLTAVIVNAAADAAVKHISDNILATPIGENGLDINAIGIFLNRDFAGDPNSTGLKEMLRSRV